MGIANASHVWKNENFANGATNMPEQQPPKKTIDERIDALTMNLELATREVELLRDSVHDLVIDTKERRRRDTQYFRALAQLFESWAGEDGEPNA
jgi:hypothetical protein